ncbi:MAG: hypothetical protein ABIK15_19405 [Pseudomonadota bacterium]
MAGKFKNVMETSAVYWEPKIKTYGFQEITDLSLLEVTMKADRFALVETMLQDAAHAAVRFHLVLMQPRKDYTAHISIIFDREWEDRIDHYCTSEVRLDQEEHFSIRSPVGLICFFGPHFGERYGIAETTFQVLAENNLRILAAGFSGSAVYLVLPENITQRAKTVFESAFEVPKSKPSYGTGKTS